jgi:beta-glucanase (GH16 family)
MTAERFLLIVASILMNTRMSAASSLWIDPATPSYAQTAIGMDNRELSLVFSDEFDDDGRAFHDGSDTRWTAEDRPATVNGALNYYNSSRVRTRSGNLVIETMRRTLHG